MLGWWRQESRSTKAWLVFGAVVILLGLLFTTGWINFFVSPHQTRETLDDGTRIITNYDQFGGTPRWRMVKMPFGLTTSGPLSDSGRRHGRWFNQTESGHSSSSWYWYGDTITEGRWHTLSK